MDPSLPSLPAEVPSEIGIELDGCFFPALGADCAEELDDGRWICLCARCTDQRTSRI